MVKVSEKTSDTWNGYVNQTPQVFMNESRRIQPGITFEQAIAQYMEQFTSMFGWWHVVKNEETGEEEETDWTQEELDDIQRELCWYLEATEGEEWQ